jgi:hypothetical protein
MAAAARVTDRISNGSTEGVDDVGPRFNVGISEVSPVTGRENVFVHVLLVCTKLTMMVLLSVCNVAFALNVVGKCT